MKNNNCYIIAHSYDNKHFNEVLHISNNKPYFLMGIYYAHVKIYKSLKCAIKKAKEVKPRFPMYENIAILQIKGEQESVVELI